MGIIDTVLSAFQSALTFLHDLIEPVAGVHSWGWAIIALTLVVRVLLLPLAIKQIRSMRAMQSLQPKMKEIQKRHKVDRSLMKQDPEKYRAKKQKLNEEMMALYQEEGVNPAASCLPLIAQAPIFLALFTILQDDRAGELAGQPFYFVTSQAPEQGLTALVSGAGWPGWLLVILMAVTMFVSQKQTMARQAATGADNPMAQQQKIMLYALPVVLAFFSFQIPLGVLLYWVTTNVWQATQQAIMLREVKHEAEEGTLAAHPGGEAAALAEGPKKSKSNSKGKGRPAAPPAASTRKSSSATSGTSKPSAPAEDDAPADDRTGRTNGRRSKGSTGASGPSSNGSPGSNARTKRDHLPRRGEHR